MTEQSETQKGPDWSRFLRKHWVVFFIFIVAVVLAIAGTVYAFTWFAGNAQSTGLVPSALNLWTMNNLVTFILHALFWELVLIGIPVAIGAIVGWQWWKRLPEKEKEEYHLFGKRLRSNGAGGGVSLLLFIAFAIKVYVDGNWNAAISSWTANYVVGSMISILIWMAIIFAVPAAIAVSLWIRREIRKTSELQTLQTN